MFAEVLSELDKAQDAQHYNLHAKPSLFSESQDSPLLRRSRLGQTWRKSGF